MIELKKQKPVVIVAIEEEDNLGVRYIASCLIKAGYIVKILDFQLANWKIHNKIIEFDPLIIGFSIIFQSHIHKFADLIKFLRDQGVSCHFTAGGHYPSLRHGDVFDLIPYLNSIVLFEGEYTFLELVKSIYNNNKWKKLNGICYKENG
ncbi:MAG: cobalamin B12-binding domain-containing protein, partial [Flavobacteriaceae bacterium]|nr:cobalamin B12-binding domain-containing protein [Flavobacteriaceae bacterium]